MSAARQPDPVELIAGPELPPRLYRCQRCRIATTYADPLPTGGATCDECGAKIHPADVLDYATFTDRLLALLIDAMLVGLTVGSIVTFVGWIVIGVAPKDEYNHLTQEAVFWGSALLIAITLVMTVSYLLVCNAIGRTVGKLAVGLAVVDVITGFEPGLSGAITRTEAQLLTALTLGVGYVVAVRDPRRQTLHDRIANTIVIET